MAYILYIDCTTNNAVTALFENREIISSFINTENEDTTVFVHTHFSKLFASHNISIQNIDAICVMNGPGSYTGLRVALASAKGFAFAYNTPIITLNKLDTILSFQKNRVGNVCALMKARENEYFISIENKEHTYLQKPTVLPQNECKILIDRHLCIVFSIEGIDFLNFFSINFSLQKIADYSFEMLENKAFCDLHTAEPFYLKEVYIQTKK